jgi:hypothetical protein
MEFLRTWDIVIGAGSGGSKRGGGRHPDEAESKAEDAGGPGRATALCGEADDELGVEIEFIFIVILN